MMGFVAVTLCQAGPWKTCSVYGFTRHCSHFSWAAAREKVTVRFCVRPRALTPALPSPCLPPVLPQWPREPPQVLLQSAALRRLFSLASHPPYTKGSQNVELALKKYLTFTPLQGPLYGGSRPK